MERRWRLLEKEAFRENNTLVPRLEHTEAALGYRRFVLSPDIGSVLFVDKILYSSSSEGKKKRKRNSLADNSPSFMDVFRLHK